MAINKKLIHFENFSDFNSKRLSANKANTKYTIGISDTIHDLAEGKSVDILWQSIVYIKDTQQQWTHGLIYNCEEIDGITIVNSIEELDENAKQGSLAVMLLEGLDLRASYVGNENPNVITNIAFQDPAWDYEENTTQDGVLYFAPKGYNSFFEAVESGVAFACGCYQDGDNTIFEFYSVFDDANILIYSKSEGLNPEAATTITEWFKNVGGVVCYGAIIGVENEIPIFGEPSEITYKNIEAFIPHESFETLYIKKNNGWEPFNTGAPIANDFDGGEYRILSAEMGKVLNERISAVAPGSVTSVAGTLNIKDLNAVKAAQELLSNNQQVTYIITDSNGNYPSPNSPTVYLDTEDHILDILYRGNGDALKWLLKNKQAYYNYNNSWYSQTISGDLVKLPSLHLRTAQVGDLITLIRQDIPAEEFYSNFVDYNNINLNLETGEKLAFDAYLTFTGVKGALESISDGEAIRRLVEGGYIYSSEGDPNKGYITNKLVSDGGLVTLYTAQITPNTQKMYSGNFWPGNMTGPGIYSYITTGRPAGSDDGEYYIGYVSPDGTQTLVSMKDPSKVYTRAKIGDTWTKLVFGVGKNIEGTGEIFNDYINNFAHSDHGHAEGQYTYASWNSHSEGINTRAGFNGYDFIAGNCHAEGDGSRALGNASHAEGINTLASGNNSHSEGDSTQASNWNAHAEGYRTIASGNGAHAEGNSDGIDDENYWNVASGFASHTEGRGTQATNNASHAEGLTTSSLGLGSHSEGGFTLALGEFSHAEGYYTLTHNQGEHAEGIRNYYEIDNLIHSVGIGDNNNRVNAHAITLDGKHYIYGIGGYEGKGIENATDLATSLNNLTTGGLDNVDSFTIDVDDEMQSSNWVLISEITDLQLGNTDESVFGFVGMYTAHSDYGYGDEESGFIVARAHLQANSWTLKTTSNLVSPYIVKCDPAWDGNTEEPNRFWIALKFTGPERTVDFMGNSINLLDSFIKIDLDAYIVPVQGPESYILSGIGVNIQAVDAGNSAHEIEESTCLKYTEQGLTDSQKQQSIKNLGLFNLNTWYNSLPTNTVTGYQKDLIGAGSYPYITTSISTDTFTILPNVFYNFGDVAGTMHIELGQSSNDITNEYMFLFKATSSNTSLNAPNIIAWNKPLDINEGRTYLISILNGLATYLEF